MTQNTFSSLTAQPQPCFLVDRMLGRLAKWLRILGYDTVYLPQLSPQGLMREGGRQGRIILTRDTRFLRQKNAPAFIFVHDDHFRKQLRQVTDSCHLDPVQTLFTRCSACNQPLAIVEKKTVQSLVPEYVRQTQDEFRRCPACQRLYWSATHKEHVLDELRKMGLIGDSDEKKAKS